MLSFRKSKSSEAIDELPSPPHGLLIYELPAFECGLWRPQTPHAGRTRTRTRNTHATRRTGGLSSHQSQNVAGSRSLTQPLARLYAHASTRRLKLASAVGRAPLRGALPAARARRRSLGCLGLGLTSLAFALVFPRSPGFRSGPVVGLSTPSPSVLRRRAHTHASTRRTLAAPTRRRRATRWPRRRHARCRRRWRGSRRARACRSSRRESRP